MPQSSERRSVAVLSRVACDGRARARARGARASPVRVRLRALLPAAATARLVSTRGVPTIQLQYPQSTVEELLESMSQRASELESTNRTLIE